MISNINQTDFRFYKEMYRDRHSEKDQRKFNWIGWIYTLLIHVESADVFGVLRL